MTRWAGAAVVALLAIAGCVVPEAPVARDELPLERFAARAEATNAPGGMPTLGVTEDGLVFVTARSEDRRWALLRSSDAGRTWQDVGPRAATAGSPTAALYAATRVDPGAGVVGMIQTYGSLVESGTRSGNCAWVGFTDAAAERWSSTAPACPLPAWNDPYVRLLVEGERMAVCGRTLESGRLVPALALGGASCAVRVAPPVSSAFPFTGGAFATGGRFFSCARPLSPIAADASGRLYVAAVDCGAPSVAVSEDDGASWRVAVLDAADEEAASLAGVASMSVAVDEGGTVYAVWMRAGLPVLATSADAGASWSEPRVIAPPGVTAADRPVVAGAGAGRAVVAFVGSAIPGGYDGKALGAGRFGRADEEPAAWEGATWAVHVGVLVDGRLSWTLAHEASDPVARGACGRTACSPPQSDSFGAVIDLLVDPAGRAWLAYSDACTFACATERGRAKTPPLVVVSALVAGPSLRGPGGPLPPAPGDA